MADDYKYHIDHHGSLVRPPGLDAGDASAADASAAAAVTTAAVTTAAVTTAVVAAAHLQRRLTLSAVSDGQFRRQQFESVVYDHVTGFSAAAAGPAPLADAAGIPVSRRRGLPAGSPEPRATGRLAADEVAPVLATVDRPVFVTLPSPGYLAALGSRLAGIAGGDAGRSKGAALAAILRDEIATLAAEGVAYVALGNPLYAPLLTVAGRERLMAQQIDTAAVLQALIEADRDVFDGLTVPENFRIGLDLTDSGPLPLTDLGYHPKAVDELLDDIPFHRVCIDFPAVPERRFPLERVKPGLVISLGVVDVSVPGEEPVADLLSLADPVIEERGEYDVAVATNGGFAQEATRPLMTEEQQTAKLRLVETLARYYWGNEI